MNLDVKAASVDVEHPEQAKPNRPRWISNLRFVGISDKRPQRDDLRMLKSDSNVRRFLRPTPEQQVVVLVESATLRQAERLIESCEHCNEEDAQIPIR